METPWDVIVIGGGAAGLSAALMLGRARRRTLVVDARAPRNRFAAHMHGVLGHEQHGGHAQIAVHRVDGADQVAEAEQASGKGGGLFVHPTGAFTCAGRLIARGVPIDRGIGKHGPGANSFLVFRDPDGNNVEFYTDMTRIDADHPYAPSVWDGKQLETFDRWNLEHFLVAPPARIQALIDREEGK